MMAGRWIKTRLDALKDAGRQKSQNGLAGALGVPPARITEIIQEKGKRELQLDEVVECSHYLELSVEMVVALATDMDPGETMPESPLSVDQRLEGRRAWLEINGSDHAMARVVEDLIILLNESGVIRLNDLPEPARDLMDHRRQLRAVRSGGSDD